MTEQRVIGLYILYDYVCSMEQKGGGGVGGHMAQHKENESWGTNVLGI